MKSLTAFALCDRIKLKSDIIFKTYMDTPVTLFWSNSSINRKFVAKYVWQGNWLIKIILLDVLIRYHPILENDSHNDKHYLHINNYM